MAFFELKNVTRVYQSGDHILKALDGIHLKLEEGKFVVVLGPSGAGKNVGRRQRPLHHQLQHFRNCRKIRVR